MIKILDSLIERFPVLACCKDDIFNSFKLIERCYENGGKLLVCGNGGSAADADPIVGELMKGFCCREKSKRKMKFFLIFRAVYLRFRFARIPG